MGIQILLDKSWFIIFFLILWSLSVGYFPFMQPEQNPLYYWLAGLLTTLLFFFSILLHELSHAVMALRSGVKILGITLFLFGGVSHMKEEAQKPFSEMKIAIVGPVTSLILAGFFWGIYLLTAQTVVPLVSSVFHYLGWINLALAIFNLIPGFPLDGGRVFRAFLWWKMNSLEKATKIATGVGKGFAILLMILGGLQILLGGFLGGLWFIFIGMFLYGLAEAGYQSLIWSRVLEKAKVQDVMIMQPVTVSPQITIQEVIDKYFLKHGHRGFPVVQGAETLGLITVADILKVPKAERTQIQVGAIMRLLDQQIRIPMQASLKEAAEKLKQAETDHLLVMDNGKLEGMMTQEGVRRFASLKQIFSQQS